MPIGRKIQIMRKSTRIVKRLLALFLVVLMSINTLGAVVSDNDGSAFITKSEFDSLKNDFQSQIDQYNTSIDSKIDGAIASYLAGLQVAKKQQKRIVLSNWNNVSMSNYALSNEWQIPNFNLAISMNGSTVTTTGAWPCVWWAQAQISYTRPSSSRCKRLIVDAGYESSVMPAYVYWIGRALNELDRIQCSRLQYSKGSVDADLGHLASTNQSYFRFTNITRLYSGYFPNLIDETTNIWDARFFWHGVDTDGGVSEAYKTPTSILNKSNALSISLLPVNNKIYEYEHILNWATYSYPQLTDTDWTNTLRYIESNRITRNQALSNAAKSSQWCGFTCSQRSVDSRTVGNITYGQTREKVFDGYYSGANGSADSNAFVGVGIINRTYDSEHIYQSSTEFTDTVDGRDLKAGNLNLIQGFPILAAKEGEKITLELEFDNLYKNGVLQSVMEQDVYLSTIPFGSGATLTDETKRIKCDKQPTGQNYMTTTDNKIKLVFEMNETSIVYLKWKPHNDSGNWSCDLNLTKNPIYIVETSS